MITRSLIVLTALLMLSSAVMSSDTRVLTMGDNNLILLEEANISLFPSRIVEYPNLAIAELGSNDMMSLGVHWKFRKDKPCVLGTYLYNDTDEEHEFSPINAPWGENKRIDLYWGTKLSDHKVGLHIARRSSSDKNEAATDKDERSMSITRLGVGLTPKGDKYDLAAEMEFLSWTEKGTIDDESPSDGAAYDISKPQGNVSFSLIARTFRKMDDDVTLIPHAGLEFGKYEYDQYATDSPYVFIEREKNNVFQINLGSGIEYTPATNVLAVMDFGIMYDKVKTETTDDEAHKVERTVSTFTLPYFKIGLDADVFRWMDLRVGATSYWNTRTDDQETVGYKDTRGWPDNETYLGFGFHWSRLNVDVHTDPELLLDGFNFISGQSNNMNFRLSAVYEMM